MTSLTLAVTADLHWGHRRGHDATRQLMDYVRRRSPGVLVLAGDIGAGPDFADCLGHFDDVPCLKVLVPGNHDLWVPTDDNSEDSLQRYRTTLPQFAQEHDFHYLDHGPVYLADFDLALVGSINWYDYSWSLEGLRQHYPGEEHRLQTKRFTRGRHNDANFVRWPLDDVRFTAEVVTAFERQLLEALERVERVIVITHHPSFLGLSFPREGLPAELDEFLWDAFSGNRRLETILSRHAERIAFAFCGHTHRMRESTLGPIRGYNIGGDYHFKRLLWLDWSAGTVTPQQFGEAEP
jgi:predicted phosphohydrolase